jgi:hypothetical protein
MLVVLELEIFLAAVVSWLEGEPVASSHAAILASLHPEDRDPLLTSAASQHPSLASHWEWITVAVSARSDQRDGVVTEHLAALENALQPLLVFSEVAENAPLDQILAAVDAAFALLCGLSANGSAG